MSCEGLLVAGQKQSHLAGIFNPGPVTAEIFGKIRFYDLCRELEESKGPERPQGREDHPLCFHTPD